MRVLDQRQLYAFIGITFGLSWCAAAALSETWLGQGVPLGTRLLTCSLFYALTMGWPPLVALWLVLRGRWSRRCGWCAEADLGELFGAAVRPRFLVLASVGAPLLAAVAIPLAMVLGSTGSSLSTVLGPWAEWELAIRDPSMVAALLTVAAFLATACLVSAQSLVEEIAWRGFVLPRLIRALGRRAGLVVHGVMWGLWYAPLFWLSDTDGALSWLRGASFVLTCTLLGIVLGWLRLVAQSIVPSVVANAALSMGAGLPYLLRGVDIGVRGAAYGPTGWLLLTLTIAGGGIAQRRTRARVQRAPIER